MRRCSLLLYLCLALAAAAARAGILTGNCRMADQPAATLLIPYFRVDLDDPAGATTLITINNAFAAPALSRVVLWTDWGVPTLAFDVYLTGFDVQTVNVRDLFNGTLPETGADSSPRGPLSSPGGSFPGCGEGTAPSPLAVPSPLGALEKAYLRAAHTGAPVPVTDPPKCLSGPAPRPGRATGYITIDAVNRCTPPTLATAQNTPADPLYFAAGGQGLASDKNVLWGDAILIEPRANLADSAGAVHIVADADFFSPGDYTFYGRFVGFDSRDDRAPLSSLYYARYVSGGAFTGGTELIVWRDSREASPKPRACGTPPTWAPLGEMQLYAFDEEENPTEMPRGHAFPLATQAVRVGGTGLPVGDPYGWLMLDLWHGDETHAQAWVGVRMEAAGRFSVGNAALRADDLCNFGP